MTALTALARAQAVRDGVAQPVAAVRHVHLAERPLVLVALTLAGEANAPLAAMIGDDPGAGRLLVVTQPRNRDERFAFAARLGEVLLGHIGACLGASEEVPVAGGQARMRYASAPQLIVPNQATVGFVRLLGRSTRYRRTSGEHAVDPAVPAAGRWLTYLADRAEVPGSCLMLAMTGALALHWAAGQSAVEDQNLAALTGWIDPPPGLTGAEAAALAEDPVSWPPAGPATDPTFDNEVLAPLIEACGRPDRSEARRRAAVSRLEEALAGQLAPTWDLMWRGIGLLRGLPAGRSVAARWDADRDAFTEFAGYLAEGGAPQPRRDSAVAAARRLSRLERLAASYAAQRAFDDPLVMAEHRLAGEAFDGVVTAAEPGRLDGSGKRRKLRPLVTVTTGDPLTIESGAVLRSPSRSAQRATVLTVARAADIWADDARSEVVLELAEGMGRGLTARPGSVPAVGERVCYTTLADSYQPPAPFPELAETPWTHGGPPVPYVPTEEDVTEAWS